MKAFVGRVMVALLFIASFYDKYENFGSDGGNTVKLMSPKVAFAKNQVETFLSEKLGSNVKFPPIEDKHLLMIAMFLEGAGAVLYIFGSSVGASMLILFLLGVTPIMHDFWNVADLSSPDFQIQQIMFLKNLAIGGALFSFVAMKSQMVKTQMELKKSLNTKKTN